MVTMSPEVPSMQGESRATEVASSKLDYQEVATRPLSPPSQALMQHGARTGEAQASCSTAPGQVKHRPHAARRQDR